MEMQAKRMDETRLRMAQIVTPNDANVIGKVFGGSILSLIDLAASATASKFAGNICVTASFDRVDFHEPIEIGELVEIETLVSFVGRTSIEVTIDVKATRLTTGIKRHVNTARVTMVAIKDGKPTPVPRLLCETHEEKVIFLAGRLRREIRADRIKQLDDLVQTLKGCSLERLDEIIASREPVASYLR